MSSRPSCREDFEIAIICALALEYNAVSLLFDDQLWDGDYGKSAGDPNHYITGRIGRHNVVLVRLSGIGKVAAASAAASIRSSYTQIKLALLVGICGGVPFIDLDGGAPFVDYKGREGEGCTEVLLGDVIVGNSVIEYDHGRQYPNGFVPRGGQGSNGWSKDLHNFLASLETDLGLQRLEGKTAQYLQEVQKRALERKYRARYNYPGFTEDRLFEPKYRHKHRRATCNCHHCTNKSHPVCDEAMKATCHELGCEDERLIQRTRLEGKRSSNSTQEPSIHFGAIASGDTVMKSGEDRDRIARQAGAIAFEMEAAGVCKELPCLVVKSVTDYADSHKNKKWQVFSAATAAAATKAILDCYHGTEKSMANHQAVGMIAHRSIPSSEPDQKPIAKQWNKLINRKGMTVVFDPVNPVADIVFLHGLGGHPWETWAYDSDEHGTFWPGDLLDKECSQARIMTWGYDIDVESSSVPEETFFSTSQELLVALAQIRSLGQSLIFVAHSLGGIILKEALRLSEHSNEILIKDIINYTSAVLFLGTPHRGDGDTATLHDIANQVAATVLKETAPQFEFGERFDAAQLSFLSQWLVHDIRVRTFHETMSLHTCTGNRSSVSKYSASFENPDDRPTALLADHFSMCRLKNVKDPKYAKVSADLQGALERIKTQKLHLRNDCLVSLYFPEMGDREVNIVSSLESTNGWLFEHPIYKEWSAKETDFLWLKGKPGAGKSTLMKEALRRMKAVGIAESVSVAGFFFTTRGNVDLQKTPLGLFRSVLHYLLQQDKVLLAAFIPIFVRKRAASHGEWQWHEEELRGFFQSAYSGEIPNVRKATLFIDALDECDDGEGGVVRDLVSYFSILTRASKLKICLSSRHYPNIKVPDCPQIFVEEHNIQDIVEFVKEKLSNADHDRRAQDLAHRISAKAEGVFLWVVLVVKGLNIDLDNERTEQDLEHTLQFVPRRLEDLFESLFADITSLHEREKIVAINQWILLAGRPLTMHELRHALIYSMPGYNPSDNDNWESSPHCLPSDPSRFLISLRSYTRGLGELFRRSDRPKELQAPRERHATGKRQRESIQDRLRKRRRQKRSSSKQYPELITIAEPISPEDTGVPHAPSSDTQNDTDYTNTKLELSTAVEFGNSPLDIPFAGVDPLLSGHEDIDLSKVFESTPLDFPPLEQETTDKPYPGDFHLDEQVLPPIARPYSKDSAVPNEIYPAEKEDTPNAGLENIVLPNSSRPRTVLRDNDKDRCFTDKDNPPVQLIHESVREFFLRGQGFAIIETGRPGQTSTLAQRHLLLAEQCAMCVDSSGNAVLPRGRGPKGATLIPKSYPFLAYAVEFLFYHLSKAELSGLVSDSLVCDLVNGNLWKNWVIHYERLNLIAEYWRLSSVLHFLCKKESFLLSRAVIKQGVNINIQDSHGLTPLHWAVIDGMSSIILFLIEEGADIHSRDHTGKTPLHRASQCAVKGRPLEALVQPLLNESTMIDIDQAGNTPFHIAARQGRADLIEILVSRGADLSTPNSDGNNPLHLAVLGGHEAVIKALIDSIPPLNAKNCQHQTPLHLAASLLPINPIRYLLSAGADVNALDLKGQTALQIRLEKAMGIGLLLNYGASVQLKSSEFGRSPLHTAIHLGHYQDMVKLIEHGADVNATDEHGQTALHYAAQRRQPRFVKYLIRVGADLSFQDRDGKTPIHVAANRDDMACFKELMIAGSDLKARDRRNKSPLDYTGSKLSNDLVIRGFLESRGYKLVTKYQNSVMKRVYES